MRARCVIGALARVKCINSVLWDANCIPRVGVRAQSFSTAAKSHNSTEDDTDIQPRAIVFWRALRRTIFLVPSSFLQISFMGDVIVVLEGSRNARNIRADSICL